MRNRMYGGVRGRKTKVGRKLLRFPPTRLFAAKMQNFVRHFIIAFYAIGSIYSYLSSIIAGYEKSGPSRYCLEDWTFLFTFTSNS